MLSYEYFCDKLFHKNSYFYFSALKGNALEISSGSGQHVVHFAHHFSDITWQPSDYNSDNFGSINAYIEDSQLPNVKPPVILDVTEPKTWQNATLDINSVDAIFNANMVHIAPIECTYGLFKVASSLLHKGGLLIMYGPFAVEGVLTPDSNVHFDQVLRSRDPSFGIRDTALLKRCAEENALSLTDTIEMPANNKILIFVKL